MLSEIVTNMYRLVPELICISQHLIETACAEESSLRRVYFCPELMLSSSCLAGMKPG